MWFIIRQFSYSPRETYSRGRSWTPFKMRVLQLPVCYVILALIFDQCVASAEFEAIYTDFWAWRKANNPEFASNVGDHSLDGQLEDYSLAALDSRKAAMDGYMTRLNGVQRDELSQGDRVSYDVLKDTIQTYIDGYKWRFYGPMSGITFLDGIQTKYDSKAGQVVFTEERGFRDFLKRIDGFTLRVNHSMERMDKAIEMNTTLHAVSLTKVYGQLDKILAHRSDVTGFAFYTPFTSALDDLQTTPDIRTELRSLARVAVTKFLEHIQTLKDYITNTYAAHTRPEYGVYSLPDGLAYYQACLKWQNSVDFTADEIFDMGLDEVARIHGSMERIMERSGHTGSVAEFFTSLHANSSLFFDNKAAVINWFEDVIRNRVGPKLMQNFRDIPDLPLEIREMSYDGPIAIYKNGAPDGSRPGVLNINLHNVDDHSKFGSVALALHEGDPGHHIQDAYALAAQGIPEFRKATDFSKYFAVPLHFPFYNSYSEGWALYAESLGEELGVYRDDYELMGRYSSEIFRAARLVVDTGIHAKGWSRERAIDYMLQYTAAARPMVEKEIDRYITWPGQATSYKVGDIKFRQLRKKAETELCKHMNILDFHYVLLGNGAMPLSVLETVVDEWIEKVKDDVNGDVCPASVGATVVSSSMLTLLLIMFYSVSFMMHA